jgi:hypothetical protein
MAPHETESLCPTSLGGFPRRSRPLLRGHAFRAYFPANLPAFAAQFCRWRFGGRFGVLCRASGQIQHVFGPLVKVARSLRSLRWHGFRYNRLAVPTPSQCLCLNWLAHYPAVEDP